MVRFSSRTLAVLNLLILITCGVYSQDFSVLGSIEGNQLIEWESVEGASGYRVEVRRDGHVFIDTISPSEKLFLKLAAGTYEYRIHVLSPFESPVSVSEWHTLQVKRHAAPVFKLKEPLVFMEGESGNTVLEAELLNLTEQPSFFLVQDETKIALNGEFKDENIALSVQPGNLGTGSWSLRAEYSSGLNYTFPGAVIIEPKRSPEFFSIDQPVITGTEPVLLEISGQNFHPDMTVTFTGNTGNLKTSGLKVINGTTAQVIVYPAAAQEGSYSLTLTNPGEAQISSETVLSIEPEKKTYTPQDFKIQFGWSPYFIFNGKQVVFSLISAETAVVFQSGWEGPFLSGLGAEIRFSMSPGIDFMLSDSNFFTQTDISLLWRPLTKKSAAPVILVGVGNSISELGGYFNRPNLFHIRAGAAVELVKGNSSYRFGLNGMVLFTDKFIFPMTTISIRKNFRI